MEIKKIKNYFRISSTSSTSKRTIFIFTFVIFLLKHSTADEDPPKVNLPPRVGQAPNFIPGNPIPQQPMGPQILGDLNQFRTELMYPYNLSDFTEITSSKPIHDQPLPFRLPFFGFRYYYIWIQRDGYIAFNRGLLSYKFPLNFPVTPRDPLIEEDPSMIAPWFALQDIPTEVPNAGVYFKMINIETEYNATLRERLYLDFREGMIGAADFKPKFAFIITWKNMTFVNRRPEMPLVTNTYQCVIATDEIRTYAMFNYENIEWITHQDNYEGLKGSAAYVGFNAGNTTRTFEFRPYSQNPRISYLTTRGWGNGLRGRYFFQIDEEVWPGCCIEKDLDPNLPDRLPLTFFPRVGHMLGGTLVNFTGPCLSPNSIITCKFENWRTNGIFRDFNHATCITPPVMYHGYVDLTITVDDRTLFLGRFYLQPPDIADDDIVVLDNTDRLEDPQLLEIKWKPTKLAWDDNAAVTMSLWGYRETNDVYPQLTYIDILTDSLRLGQLKTTIDPTMYRDRNNVATSDIIFGFIALNLTNPSILGKDIKQSPVIYSRPMPLSWYFKRQWEREYGNNGKWKEHFCKKWFLHESYSDRFATTVFRCPCTLPQAMLDRGRFSPDLECNVVDRKCDTFHRGAQHCIKTGRPSIGGSGQTCCYDDYNELLQTADTMYGGRPSRAFIYGKHPFKMQMMIPALSYWLHDVMPFFFCCKWQPTEDNAHTCQMLNYWRTSQDCSSYQNPAIGSVYGDPHFVTFDRFNYTFNGKGEFALVHVDNAIHKLEVQGRFEQVPRNRRTDPLINATRLTAVAARDNISSIVEFRIRPDAARWRYHMYIIVDKEYVFWWDESMRLQYFRGVTLYQPAGIQNMSHVIAMFDSGAGVEVNVEATGHMTVHVYAPYTFLNGTAGLLGRYSRDYRDDFTLPGGQQVSVQSPQDVIYNQFGMAWRVQERVSAIDQRNVIPSIFWHNTFQFAYYDDTGFIPEYGNPPRLPDFATHLEADMLSICSDSVACQYDYILTLNREFAKITKEQEAYALWLSNEATNRVTRCPALPRPLNGRKSENRYWVGTIVRFSCDDGYRLVGYEARRCREDGLWSWGVDPECISDLKYTGQIAGIGIGIVVPILIVLVLIVGCFIYSRKNGRDHYTGERGAQQQSFPEWSGKSNSDLNSGSGKPIKEIETQAREAEC